MLSEPVSLVGHLIVVSWLVGNLDKIG